MLSIAYLKYDKVDQTAHFGCPDVQVLCKRSTVLTQTNMTMRIPSCKPCFGRAVVYRLLDHGRRLVSVRCTRRSDWTTKIFLKVSDCGRTAPGGSVIGAAVSFSRCSTEKSLLFSQMLCYQRCNFSRSTRNLYFYFKCYRKRNRLCIMVQTTPYQRV